MAVPRRLLGDIMIAIANLDDNMEGSTPSFRIGVRNFGRFVLSLPLFGFLACVLVSLINNFEGSTATHCGVNNYLPSASSAIGGYTPQRYIWRICIALHCAPRFFYTALYYNHYLTYNVKSLTRFYEVFVAATALLNVVENLCLVVLTFVSSTENYDVHESSFIGFMVFSELHMLFTVVLWFWTSTSQSTTPMNYNSLRLKVVFFLVNLLSFGAAVYFFFRHNSYCEPGVYTWFAICEYLIITSNIAFHGTATVDFSDRYLIVVSGSNMVMHKTKPS